MDCAGDCAKETLLKQSANVNTAMHRQPWLRVTDNIIEPAPCHRVNENPRPARALVRALLHYALLGCGFGSLARQANLLNADSFAASLGTAVYRFLPTAL